jgi:UDP:flavonoid glycosyltransferase YjiC (YdhE family)
MNEVAGARILVAAFGSAGDLFPLVPVIERLRRDGHDVRCALSRPLGLYARVIGVPAFALGSGGELRVFDDERTITTRFGGWASWRQLMATYVAPTVAEDLARLGKILARWRPDLVVTGSFSPAARAAAHHHGIPRVELTIYPQHVQRLRRARAFGLALRKAVADTGPLDGGATGAIASDLAWGAGDHAVILHDPALLGAPEGLDAPVVGFPYWDAGPHRSDDADEVAGWLDGATGPTVAVTLGSFLGLQQRLAWREAAKAVEALGVRAVFIGAKGRADDEVPTGAGIVSAGFVPLSHVLPRVDAVVHHGGIGTMFSTLRSGRPAVVVPQAFDQPANAGLVERAGAGLDASDRPFEETLAAVLRDARYRDTAERLAAQLVGSDVATERAVTHIIERLG